MAKGVKYIIHDILEFTRGVFESKWDYIPFIVTKGE